MPSELDRRRDLLRDVQQALAGHHIDAEVTEPGPLLRVGGPDGPVIGCAPRACDGGTLWLLQAGGDQEPVAPAGAAHLHEVVVWVKGQLAALPS